MRNRAQLVAILVLSALQCFAQNTPGSAWSVAWEPKELVNGSAVLFRVTAPPTLNELRGSWPGHEIGFRYDNRCKCWYAIAGISLEAAPGKYPLQLQGSAQGSQPSSFTSQVPIVAKHYPTTTISVAPQYVQPPKEVLARIEEELALKKRVFSQIAPESVCADRFLPPVESNITAVFGSSRTYNGCKHSYHLGLDFRAAVGTTARAANRGTLILASNLYSHANSSFLHP